MNSLIQHFEADFLWIILSVESQPQNPEFKNDPDNFHPMCMLKLVCDVKN